MYNPDIQYSNTIQGGAYLHVHTTCSHSLCTAPAITIYFLQIIDKSDVHACVCVMDLQSGVPVFSSHCICLQVMIRTMQLQKVTSAELTLNQGHVTYYRLHVHVFDLS